MSRRQAIAIKTNIERLIDAKATGIAPDLDVSRWVAERDDTFHAKLAQHGLVTHRARIEISTLARFIESYIASRTVRRSRQTNGKVVEDWAKMRHETAAQLQLAACDYAVSGHERQAEDAARPNYPQGGLTPCPKLFQNLRITRATELAADYPFHVAAEWIGHSTVVANKHYWRVTEADYEWAIQKAQQKAPQDVGTGRQASEQECEKPGDLDNHRLPVAVSVLPEGLEPSTY